MMSCSVSSIWHFARPEQRDVAILLFYWICILTGLLIPDILQGTHARKQGPAIRILAHFSPLRDRKVILS